ncbi:MAG: hypothetical protein M1269_00465 [Chloroflexi bacterium]|nr:hypothetical protein [Chloroflexota bacterium]
MSKKILGWVILVLLVLIVVQVVWLTKKSREAAVNQPANQAVIKETPKTAAGEQAAVETPEAVKPGAEVAVKPGETKQSPKIQGPLADDKILAGILYLQGTDQKLTPEQTAVLLPIIKKIPEKMKLINEEENKLSPVLSEAQIGFIKKMDMKVLPQSIKLVQVSKGDQDPLIATVLVNLEKAVKDNVSSGQKMSNTKVRAGSWPDIAWGVIAMQKDPKVALTADQAKKLSECFTVLNKETVEFSQGIKAIWSALNEKQQAAVTDNIDKVSEMSQKVGMVETSQKLEKELGGGSK